MDLFYFIGGVVHHDPPVNGNECHHQMPFNFGKGQTVIPAQLVQWTVNQCKSGPYTTTLSG
jgi:hypothetical protein